MQSPPRVSVVITLHNKAPFVKRAIASVLWQSYSSYEITVVDDGSTDGGGELVARIPEARIRLIRQKNQGEGAARNRGIRESQGEIIAMLDADDEWDPGFLMAVVELAERFPQAGILATGYRSIYRGSFVVETTLEHAPGEFRLLVTDYFLKASVAVCVCASSQAIPRRVYNDVGVFVEREPMGPDLDMWGRIAFKYPIGYDCRIMASYRNDASGRTVAAWASAPTFPPFIRSARAAIETGSVPSEVVPDVCEYMNRLLLQYIERVIAAGNRREFRRILREEFYPTNAFGEELAFLRLAARFLPMRFLYAIRRVKNSRLGLIVRRQSVENGVVRRIGMRHQPQQAGGH